MDDVRAAFLGDHEAAKRLTEKGVLVGCPGCGGNDLKECYACGDHFVFCKVCEWAGPTKNSPTEARLAWNARAAILSESELKKLEE